MNARLYVLSGSGAGKSYTLADRDTLGRSPECTITLRDKSVSRLHARIERDGERWFVVDEDSRNGITVDRMRTPRLELVDKLEFQLGELLLRFRMEDAAPAALAGAAKSTPSGEPRPAVEPASAPEPAPRPAAAPKLAPASEPSSGLDLEEPDEIVLEGPDEIELAAPAPPPRPAPAPPAPQPTRAPAPPPAPRAPSRPPPAPEPEVVARRSTPADTGFGPARGGGAPAPRTRTPGDRVLQYHKVSNDRSRLAADVTQLPAWMRYGLYVLGLALAAAIFWVALRGTSFLKQKARGPESAVELEEG